LWDKELYPPPQIKSYHPRKQKRKRHYTLFFKPEFANISSNFEQQKNKNTKTIQRIRLDYADREVLHLQF